MKRCTRFLARLLPGALFTLAASAAEPVQWVLEDLLNRAWKDEPVAYTVTAEPGTSHVAGFRLHGPEGPVACQLSEVELWPETPFVKSAKVWFITSLNPLERREYTLNRGATPSPEPAPADDLIVGVDGPVATFETNGFGVRLRLGRETFAEPATAADIPGPVLGMRLADGTWFGGSELYGPAGIRAWSGEVTARGPVFGEVRYRYEYADGNQLELAVRLFARADRVQFDADVLNDSRDNGLRVFLCPGLAPLTLHVQKLFHTRRDIYPRDLPIGEWWRQPVAAMEPGLVHAVSPWGPWWNDWRTPVVRLGIGNLERELHVARRDPAAWVKPADEDTEQESAHHKNLAIRKAATGEIYLDLDLAAGTVGGVRRFDLADSPATEAVGWRHRRDHRYRPPRRTGAQVITYPVSLNEVKDYVLDWPQKIQHPRLFLAADEIAAARPAEPDAELLAELQRGTDSRIGAHPHNSDIRALALWLLTGDDQVAREYRLPERLEQHLGLLGDFDKMRATNLMAILYDQLIDSGLVPADQRRMLRAQMAYLAYQVNHPTTWSNARGWNSGNQNMTVSYAMMGPGIMAAVLADHPMAETWMAPALEIMEFMLDKVGPGGEWPESTGYSNLSVGELLIFGIMATRAGFADYLNDPRLRRAVEHLIKIRQPADPRTGDRRDHIRYGRSPGQTRALDGILARATLDTDPEYAKQLQWTWMDTLRPGAQSMAFDLGGLEYLYLDPTLPAAPPDWQSEMFPHMGVIFRQGFATPHEHFVALLSGDHRAMIYGSQTGALASLFAYGRPVAGSFLGHYGDQVEFLVSRVSLARSPHGYVPNESPFFYLGSSRSSWWFDADRPLARFMEQEGDGNVSAFAALPRQDYAAVDVLMKIPAVPLRLEVATDIPWPELIAGDGEPPLWWRRQSLFLKDDDPAGANYLLLRDTVSGGQPTMWTFWTASEAVGTPAEMADRQAVLDAAPGEQIVPPRRLTGDRFTALGAWGVDLEYYIAAPADTPRHTLRWGTNWNVSRPWGVTQFQDLLHLQRADDGVYYVALFPRRPDDPAPVFTTLGDGHIIRVGGDFGTDYGFLAALPAEVAGEEAAFRGTAASVQDRTSGLVLSLGAAGSVTYREHGIASEQPVSLRVRADGLTLEWPHDHVGSTVTLRAPGALRVREAAAGVTLTAAGPGRWTVTVPTGINHLELEPN